MKPIVRRRRTASRLTASQAAASTSTFTGRFAHRFSFFSPRSDHVGAVNGIVVLDRGFLEYERTSSALAVLPRDLLQRLRIAVVDDRREVERCRRFVEEASTASAGSPRGTGNSVPVRWEGFGLGRVQTIR